MPPPRLPRRRPSGAATVHAHRAGAEGASDWAAVHDRLLDDFPGITDVLATTMTATLLIVYEGDANVDAWLEGISDGILSRRLSAGNAPRVRTQSRAREPPAGLGCSARAARPPAPCPPGPYQLNHSTPTNERHDMSRSDVTSARPRSSRPATGGLEARWRGRRRSSLVSEGRGAGGRRGGAGRGVVRERGERCEPRDHRGRCRDLAAAGCDRVDRDRPVAAVQRAGWGERRQPGLHGSAIEPRQRHAAVHRRQHRR